LAVASNRIVLPPEPSLPAANTHNCWLTYASASSVRGSASVPTQPVPMVPRELLIACGRGVTAPLESV
jgi:hypothetical protein